MSAYLVELTLRLATGIGRWPQAEREVQAAYFLNAQTRAGGFPGREGPADLYYTAFGLRALSVLGRLEGETADLAARYLRSQLSERHAIVDLFSLIYAAQLLHAASGIDVLDQAPAWRVRVSELLARLRRDDGGFARTLEGHRGSTYQTFLALLCLQLLEQPIERPESIAEFLLHQRSPEGGFLEIRAAKRAGVNPTAAAVGGLRILDRLTPEIADETVDFLLQSQTDEGGFCAHSRIPLADLLSSFTALVTLIDLGAARQADLAGLEAFVAQLAWPGGGFRGGVFDAGSDVEYSFYGLGCRGLLCWLASGPEGQPAG